MQSNYHAKIEILKTLNKFKKLKKQKTKGDLRQGIVCRASSSWRETVNTKSKTVQTNPRNGRYPRANPFHWIYLKKKIL